MARVIPRRAPPAGHPSSRFSVRENQSSRVPRAGRCGQRMRGRSASRAPSTAMARRLTRLGKAASSRPAGTVSGKNSVLAIWSKRRSRPELEPPRVKSREARPSASRQKSTSWSQPPRRGEARRHRRDPGVPLARLPRSIESGRREPGTSRQLCRRIRRICALRNPWSFFSNREMAGATMRNPPADRPAGPRMPRRGRPRHARGSLFQDKPGRCCLP